MAKQISLGSKYYIFKHDNSDTISPTEDHLLITAHGGYASKGGLFSKQGNRASEALDECAQEVVAPTCLFELHAV